MSLEEAEAFADFTLVFPTWLPEGFELARVDVLGGEGFPMREVALVYRNLSVEVVTEGPHEIVIGQHRCAQIPLGWLMVAAELEEERVGGSSAAFWGLTIPAPALVAGEATRTLALWERGDLLINVNAAGLSRGEIIRVLESLAEQP